MRKIILASTSPRRKELLEKLGIAFEVVPSDYEEDMRLALEPKELAEHLSREKAKAVAGKYKNAIIIAADTFIILEGEVFGKPAGEEEARKMLKKISGKPHFVITGFTIMDSKNKKTVTKSAQTKVYIKKLKTKEINDYIKSKEPLDKAGAYAIQGLGAFAVEKIEGDYFNVVGLPIGVLAEELKKFDENIVVSHRKSKIDGFKIAR